MPELAPFLLIAGVKFWVFLILLVLQLEAINPLILNGFVLAPHLQEVTISNTTSVEEKKNNYQHFYLSTDNNEASHLGRLG